MNSRLVAVALIADDPRAKAAWASSTDAITSMTLPDPAEVLENLTRSASREP